MKTSRLSIIFAISTLLVTTNAWCASWTIPANIKFVQPTATGTYTTIQAALNSITTASATNRFLIKVTPGTYTSTAASPIVMKKFVDIEGSGPENTVITSTIDVGVADALWGQTALAAGTLVVPNTINGTTGGTVTLSNLTVRNTSTTGGIAILALGHVNLDNVSASASGNPTVVDRDYCALAAEGGISLVSVHGGVFSAANVDAGYNAHVVAAGAFRGGHLKLNDATISATGGGWTVALAAIPNSYAGTVEASACTLSVDPTLGGWDLDVNETNLGTVTGSKLTVAGTIGGVFNPGGTLSSITHSEVRAHSAEGSGSGGAFASCLLDTTYDATMKIVNCWDATFTALPNQ